MARPGWTTIPLLAALALGVAPATVARELVADLGGPIVTRDLPAFSRPPDLAPKPTALGVLETQSDIAVASYEDSVAKARLLRAAVAELVDKPSLHALAAARVAWRVARIPYQQTEVFRFGDAEIRPWEARVSGWPIAPGFIDYVTVTPSPEELAANPLATANVIANPVIRTPGGSIDARTLSPSLLAEGLWRAGGIDRNVSTGFHVIEFLLWGEDDPAGHVGEGRRGIEDFSTGPEAARRGAYLLAATDLLVTDLEQMVDEWRPGGAARARLLDGGLVAAIGRMMALSGAGLASGQIGRDLEAGAGGREPDSFSASTQVSYLMSGVGIRSAYLGRYVRMDGRIVEGPSLSALVALHDAALDAAITGLLESSVGALVAVTSRAERQEPYRLQLSAGNDSGNAVVRSAIDALTAQTEGLQQLLPLFDRPAD